MLPNCLLDRLLETQTHRNTIGHEKPGHWSWGGKYQRNWRWRSRQVCGFTHVLDLSVTYMHTYTHTHTIYRFKSINIWLNAILFGLGEFVVFFSTHCIDLKWLASLTKCNAKELLVQVMDAGDLQWKETASSKHLLCIPLIHLHCGCFVQHEREKISCGAEYPGWWSIHSALRPIWFSYLCIWM